MSFRPWRTSRLVFAAIASAILLGPAAGQAPPEPQRLFEKVAPPFFAKLMDEQKAENTRIKKAGIEVVGVVQLRADLLRPATAGVERSLLLNLGETIDLKVDVPGGPNIRAPLVSESAQAPPGHGQWVGAAKDVPNSLVTFSYADGTVVGSIRVKGTTLKIRPAVGSKDHYVVERINLRAYPQEADPTPPPDRPTPEKRSEEEAAAIAFVKACAEDHAIRTAKVLFLYTDDAEQQAGSAESLNAIVADFIGQANLALRYSKVRLRIVAVRSPLKLAPPLVKQPIVRPATLEEYVATFAKSADVADLRKQYGVRLVTLLDKIEPIYHKCGRGRVMTSITNTDTGYNIVDFRCAWDNLSFIHEFGHNLGAGHNKDMPGHVTHLYDFSFGMRWPGKFRSIMSYDCDDTDQQCVRVERFTNPRIGYNDVESFGDADFADNAKTLNRTRCFFAD